MTDRSARKRMPTAAERLAVVERFQAYCDAAFRANDRPTPELFLSTLSASHRVNAKALRRWYKVYRSQGAETLATPQKRGGSSIFRQYPEIDVAAKQLAIDNPAISAARLCTELASRFPATFNRGQRAMNYYLTGLRRAGIIDPLAKAKNRYLR